MRFRRIFFGGRADDPGSPRRGRRRGRERARTTRRGFYEPHDRRRSRAAALASSAASERRPARRRASLGFSVEARVPARGGVVFAAPGASRATVGRASARVGRLRRRTVERVASSRYGARRRAYPRGVLRVRRGVGDSPEMS